MVSEKVDIIEQFHGKDQPQIDVLDAGHVALIDCMPRLVEKGKTADDAVVQAARVSYGAGTKKVNEDRGLIRYLMRHSHTTPFEMIEFKFRLKMPMFVARQHIRHRTANVNEASLRYSKSTDEYWMPDSNENKSVYYYRTQSKTNRQGSSEDVVEHFPAKFQIDDGNGGQLLLSAEEAAFFQYHDLLNLNVAREQARTCLPVSTYTEMYWKIDLHNLLHYLSLRADSHAQKEIQEYAIAMLELIKPIVPVTIEAWDDYHPMRGAIKLTRLEKEALARITGKYVPPLETDNKREQKEWEEKALMLGLRVE